jgi:hypothetical protein
MTQEATEIWAAIRGLGTLAALISVAGAALTWIVSIRVRGFQSVQDVKVLTAEFALLKVHVTEVLRVQVSASSEMAEFRSDVKHMNDLLGKYVDAVGELQEHEQREKLRLHDRLDKIERDGCAAYAREHGGNGHSKDGR